MTYAFLRDTGFNLNENAVTAEQYMQLDLLEASMDAIRDGVSSSFVVQSGTTYSYSLIQELLDNVKALLLELVQQTLLVLNNLYTNGIKLLEKYQEILVMRLGKISDPILHETYAYPDKKDYPKVIRVGTIERDVNRLVNSAKSADSTITGAKVGYTVDNMLHSFGHTVTEIAVDVHDLKGTIERNITKKAQGKKVVITVTADTLQKYIDQIKRYKEDHAELMKLKKDLVDEYSALKQMHMKALRDPVVLMKNTVRYQVNPEKEEFLAKEYNRYADINTELLRLFNGYITIYQVAFDTRLRILQKKYNDRREFITKLFTATGIFAAINNRDAKEPIRLDTRKQTSTL